MGEGILVVVVVWVAEGTCVGGGAITGDRWGSMGGGLEGGLDVRRYFGCKGSLGGGGGLDGGASIGGR